MLLQVRSAAAAGLPVAVTFPPGSFTLDHFTFDSSSTASEIVLAGAQGAVLVVPSLAGSSVRSNATSTSSRRARSLQSSSSASTAGTELGTTLFTFSGGAIVRIVNFVLRGRIQATGGTLELINCTVDGAGLPSTSNGGFGVTGGTVRFYGTTVKNYDGGGIEVTGGTVSFDDCELSGNGRGLGARFGALRLNGGSVSISRSQIVNNGRYSSACANGIQCVKGGGVRLTRGSVELSAGSFLKLNRAFEGSSIYIDSDNEGTSFYPRLSYRLPTPLGHYVIITNRGLVAELSTPLVDDDFPYECAASRYGNSTSREDQSSPRCSGMCPAGHYCETGAVQPVICALGEFCSVGSTTGTPCPAGTFGSRLGLTSQSECSVCPAGSRCEAGSSRPSLCETGTFSSAAASSNCTMCDAGTYQDIPGQSACAPCPPGHFCGEGSRIPTPCRPGYYSNATGLSNYLQCLPCTLGSYCPEGSRMPQPCYAGARGRSMYLTNQAMCEACPTPTFSTAGTSHCSLCIERYFRVPGVDDDADAGAKCKSCDTYIQLSTMSGAGVEGNWDRTSTEDDAISCPPGTTLEDMRLGRGHWRLSSTSRVVSKCRWSSRGDTTPCEGGTGAGPLTLTKHDGSAYCAANHTGPFCELCTVEGQYFNSESAQCMDCPPTNDLIVYTVVALGIAAVLAGIGLLLLLRPPRCLTWLSLWMHLAIIKVGRYALIPKVKIIIAAFQVITAIPIVYEVSLPMEYHEKMRPFMIFDFDYDTFFIPGDCLPGGFFSRMVLRGLAPWALIGAIFVLGMLKETITQCCKGSTLNLSISAVKVLPVMLFVLFCMCTSVSSTLFAAWNCIEVELSTSANISDGAETVVLRRFLRNDLSISCDVLDTSRSWYTLYADPRYAEIVWVAIILVLIWPIGVPCLYLFILVPNRHALLERRSTRVTRATAFLHREYDAHLYFWEAVFVLERLVVVGFVQWIGQPLIRLQIGLLVTIGYMTLQLYLRPFKRHDLDVIAIGAQLFLVGFFFGAINIKLHAELTNAEQINAGLAKSVLGFSSAGELALAIFVLNMCNLGLFGVTTLYQLATTAPVRTLRLVATKQPPDLTLDDKIKWHLFLSHTWSSGQDQVSVIKRQMQLLLPAIRVFLDIDDLENIHSLESYVARSQCVLLFYSRGYFFSENCLREVDEAVHLKKPLIVCHEADPQRGGVELLVLRADCESKGRDAETLIDKRSIIPWLRRSEFQLMSLKMIAEELIPTLPQFTTKDIARAIEAQGKDVLYMPGEISRTKLEFRKEVVLYVSPYNPGAQAVAEELEDRVEGGGAKTKLHRVTELILKKPALSRSGATRNLHLDSEDVYNPDPRLQRAPSEVNLQMGAPDTFESARVPVRPTLVRGESSGERFVHTAIDRVRRMVRGTGAEATHMLLNLNAQTFIGYNGAVLAYEVRKARMQGLPLVLVHECDPLRDGCGFDRFLQSTPQDLINTGLYRRLAVPLQPGAHRVISIHLLARELGASKISSRLRRKLSDSSSTIRHGVSMVASTISPRNAKEASYCANPAASPSMPVISISATERPGECSATPNGSRRRSTAHFQVDFDRAPAMPRASARAYPTTIVGTRLEGVPTTIVGTRIEQPTRMADQASAEMASEQGYPGEPRTARSVISSSRDAPS